MGVPRTWKTSESFTSRRCSKLVKMSFQKLNGTKIGLDFQLKIVLEVERVNEMSRSFYSNFLSRTANALRALACSINIFFMKKIQLQLNFPSDPQPTEPPANTEC